MLLLCALVVGSMNVWAANKVLTFDVSSNPGGWPTSNSTTLTNYTYTLSSVDYTFALSNVKCNSGYLMITATGVLGLPAIADYKLTKVVASNSSGCSTSTKVGISSSSSSASYISGGGVQTWSTTSSSYTYTLTGTSANTMYYLYVTNKNAQVTQLELTYESVTPAYTITAQSNNNEWGTVSLSGSVITGSPNTGYRYATPAYTVTSGTATVEQVSNAFTVTPTSNCTVQINFEVIPTHTASFSVNGVIDPADNDDVAEGSAITFPSDPSNISGKKFVGWYTAEYRNASVAPTFVNTASTNMGNSDITYYAVFASGSVTKYTDDLTTSTFGSPSGYTDWSGKSATEGSAAVYAGNSTTYSSSNIQIRATSPSGIISTTSGGKAKKVTVNWNSNTSDGRTLDIYGKSTAYSASSELYGATPGTKIGSIVYGTSTELNISGDYTYIGMRSNDGAMYLSKISIDWEDGSYSDYNTTVTVNPSDPVDDGAGHLTLTTTANMDGWRAFYNASQDYSVDANTKIYVAKAKSATEDVVELTAVVATKIPKGEAVVLKTTDAGHSMTLTETTGAATLGANVLAVTDGTNNVDGYRMGYGKIGASDAVGFFKYTTTTAPAAGIVYIDKSNVNVSAGAHGLAIDFGETTAIKTVNAEQLNVAPRKMMKDGRIVIKSAKGTFTLSGARMK